MIENLNLNIQINWYFFMDFHKIYEGIAHEFF